MAIDKIAVNLPSPRFSGEREGSNAKHWEGEGPRRDCPPTVHESSIVAEVAPHPSRRFATGPFPLPAALRLQGEGERGSRE